MWVPPQAGTYSDRVTGPGQYLTQDQKHKSLESTICGGLDLPGELHTTVL